MTILVTGGLGFIGSNFIRKWSSITNEPLICVDNNKLGTLEEHQNLFLDNNKIIIESIGTKDKIKDICLNYLPRLVINFAAESNVDKSIINPYDCYKNNCIETLLFLEQITNYYLNNFKNKKMFQFIQISTDEVYGSLGKRQKKSLETDILNPKNPYSASKVACEHMLMAFQNTYGLPYKISRCTNNFGPFQSLDKLIPKTINSFLNKKNVPIYGKGNQIRDWIYVSDHINAILQLIEIPERQLIVNIGANNEITNLEIVKKIAYLLDEMIPMKGKTYKNKLKFIEDRPGHDQRYAVNASKLKNLTNWKPNFDFERSLRNTILFYSKYN
jgi:dTDP-glucose 4,6-dehydratase